MKLSLEGVAQKFGYDEFLDHVDALLEKDMTTGTNHSPQYLDYTRMNQQRSHRVYKTTTIGPDLAKALQALQKRYLWVVIGEAWCGDVPQNLPIIAKAAEQSNMIELKVILRDENPEIMQHFLTNGGMAIPILVIVDAETQEVITHWGPRPAPAQQMVRDYKALEVKQPYQEFVKELQLWYLHDKTQTLQGELLQIVAGLES
jgi:hypothetical protein